MKPQEIEDLSFEIIASEAGDHGFNDEQWPVVRRIIHTTADFEYLASIRFNKDAVQTGVRAIRSGCAIFTDTNMARVGIRKKEIQSFGGSVDCLIADPGVAQQAKTDGTTRAAAAVDQICDRIDKGIYVVGNAPTALLRLIEKIKAGEISLALVVGFPVGFVNAAESKDALMELDIPYITNQGRKGGSNIAAAVINALAIAAASGDK